MSEPITAEDICLVEIIHWSLTGRYITGYRDNKLGIQREVIVRRVKGGTGVGSSKEFFFIDGDSREFRTLESLLIAYNEHRALVEEINKHGKEIIHTEHTAGPGSMPAPGDPSTAGQPSGGRDGTC